jgi:DNA-binding PadR family transcriptional regulator
MAERRRKVSNPLGLAILSLLKESPMHPYQMASTLRQRSKEDSIRLNYGALYAVIAALEREGFILPRETVREGARPERTVYGLTDKGELELHDWMSELLSIPAKEYPQFEAALSLMPILPPDETEALLRARAVRLEAEIARQRAVIEVSGRGGLERVFMIETEYEVAMREAELGFVKKLVELIRSSSAFTRNWRAFHDQHAVKQPGVSKRQATPRRKKESK